jgi:hypothetical protein
MPLYDGYGVLVGTLQKYYCDHVFNQKAYYHCNLKVRAGKKFYRCPVDLDCKKDAHGVQWRVVELESGDLQQVFHLQEGWYPLDSVPDSGALDYYLSPVFQPKSESGLALPDSENRSENVVAALSDSWKNGTGPAAFKDLEPLLIASRKLFIFGEPFRTGNGVHNIHQNQGDPLDSQWYPENGIWQDGAVIVLRHDNTIAAFLCKFNTQRFLSAS